MTMAVSIIFSALIDSEMTVESGNPGIQRTEKYPSGYIPISPETVDEITEITQTFPQTNNVKGSTAKDSSTKMGKILRFL